MWPRDSESRRLGTSLLIAAFLGASLFAGFSYGDAYPFSNFPMYSVARSTPYEPPQYEMVGVTQDGRTTDQVRAPLGTSLFITWARDAEGDPERARMVGELLLDYNQRRTPELELMEIRVYKHTFRIPAYPDRGDPEMLETEVIYEIDR